MNDQDRKLRKLMALVALMRKYQQQFFRSRMEYDKKEAMKYEKQVDEYMRQLIRSGIVPLIENDNQGTLL
jgi:phosphate uptake regulator